MTSATSKELKVKNQNKRVPSHSILFIGSEYASQNREIFEHYFCIIVQNYFEALQYLQRVSETPSAYPDALVSYYKEDEYEAITKFSKFLYEHFNDCIPFFLMEKKQGTQSLQNSGPIAGIDDIVSEDISCNDLINKITVLKKFKSLRKSSIKKHGEGNVSIPRARRILYKIDPFLKRSMDILISSLALLILLPFMFIIALIIKLESKGPVFYTAYRAGSNYRIFKFMKFRTMIADADKKISELVSMNQYNNGQKNSVFFKVSNDPRVTRFGRFLRNTSLDELPQLFNIIKGEMSLVGNRPLPLYEAKELTTDDHVERFAAPAGITGLWQVTKRGKKKMSEEERIALDIRYARKRSFLYDWKIILHTPKALFQKEDV